MKFSVSLIIVVLLTSCSGNSSDISVKDIAQLEQNKNLSGSDSMINSYIRFADAQPEHDSSVNYLFKAAQICIRSNKVVKGARLYERIATEYKGNSYAPEALIRGGTAFATVPDPANAKRLYDMFIAAYPEHARIEEVKMWSLTAGMTEEELFKFFKSEILPDSSK